jgi:tetratricopeptide (TPR) repeat protein
VVLAGLGLAIFLGGGKKRPGPDQKRAPIRAVVESAKPAPLAQPPTEEKPALPAAAVEPAKLPAPAESEPGAAGKIAAPAEKPPSAPIPVPEKPRPVEKKVAAEKPARPERPVAHKPAPAHKPVAEEPIADKAKSAREPAAPNPEKRQAEVATSGAQPAGSKTQEAAEAYQRGTAKLLSGALMEAIAAFSEALKLNPKDAQSQRGLGLAYAQAGSAGQAVRHLKLYLKASPSAPDRALIEKRIAQLGGR